MMNKRLLLILELLKDNLPVIIEDKEENFGLIKSMRIDIIPLKRNDFSNLCSDIKPLRVMASEIGDRNDDILYVPCIILSEREEEEVHKKIHLCEFSI